MTKNIGIKIVSLAIAIFLWLQLNLTETHRETININIKLVNLAENLTVTKISPEQIKLQLEGNGKDLIAYYIKKQDYVIDLNEIGIGTHIFVMDFSVLNKNDNLAIISDREQNKIAVTIDKVVRREVDIEFQFLDENSHKFFSEHKMILNPKKITIKGAKSKLDTISSLSIEPFSIENFRDGYQILKVIPPDNNIELLTEYINVTYEEALYVKRTIALVPIIKPENFHYDFTPKHVAIKIKGPPDIISNLSRNDFSVYIDTTNKIGKDTYSIKFVMPSKEVSLLDFTPANVKIYNQSSFDTIPETHK